MTDVEHSPAAEVVTEKGQSVKVDFAQYVQNQFAEIRKEVTDRLHQISTHFPVSSEDLAYLKDTLKIEFTTVLEDVTQTSKDIKQELTELSTKHKAHLTETFKRSKGQAVEAFSKINLSQVKENGAEPAVVE